jgi:hypothetical protein
MFASQGHVKHIFSIEELNKERNNLDRDFEKVHG